jgi:hypothetical protein
MQNTSQFKKLLISMIFCLVSQYSMADAIDRITSRFNADVLHLTWNALGESWHTRVTIDSYLGANIPLIEVDVTTGNETLIEYLPNCYYRGTLNTTRGDPIPLTTVFINLCENSLPFTGFVAKDSSLYRIESDSTSSTGISMIKEFTAKNIDGTDELVNGDNGWKEGGSGGVLTPTDLVSRGATPNQFPSIDVYVNPSYRSQVGEANYIGRIIETMVGANTIYAQSNMKQIHLKAIVLLNQDISITTSQGNILHGLEKIRKYTVLPDSADVSMVYSGGEFSMPYLWGWVEGGYGCYLQRTVLEGDNINTHNIGKSAHAIIDLPTTIQRAWIFAHETGHSLGMPHIGDDPLADGSFQPNLALKDYVAGCSARSYMLESCAFDSQNNKFTDFYECP